MKKNVFWFLGGILASILITGCASNEAGMDPAFKGLQPTPAMKRTDVMVVVEDQRPNYMRSHHGTSNIERPEIYFNNTINLAGFTVDYLTKSEMFKSVSTTRTQGCCTLKLVWKSAHLNINGWIPFVLRFQNHMTLDMVFLSPDGKTLWTYLVDGQTVNTPSVFRHFSGHRVDLFQQKILLHLYPAAVRDMCLALSTQLK